MFIKDATVALLRHEKLEGSLPAAVNGFVLDVVRYCADAIKRDCVPLIVLAAECMDYQKMLYKGYGKSHAGDELPDATGDTLEWRQGLDFADRVDAIKVQWNNTKEWTTAQIVETNPAHQLLKLHYDKWTEVDDKWVDRFSSEIAPHRTQSLRAAAMLQTWKDGECGYFWHQCAHSCADLANRMRITLQGCSPAHGSTRLIAPSKRGTARPSASDASPPSSPSKVVLGHTRTRPASPYSIAQKGGQTQ